MKITNSPEYIMVVGHGRSGTNMVLDMLDCHPNTFCRNEPNELVGTAFSGLGDPMFLDPDPEDFGANWISAVARSRTSCGHRDRPLTMKHYLRHHPAVGISQYLMQRPKFRKLFMRRTGGRTIEEWTSPALYVDHRKLAHALPVFKILLCPAWTIKAHDVFLGQRVVHVMRKPEQFVQSWWSRYVQREGGGPEAVFAENQPSVKRILEYFGLSTEARPRYSLENLIISELWRWRYVNEVLVSHLAASPRYLQIDYDEANKNQLGWSEKVFAFADLTMTNQCRQAVGKMRNTLFKARDQDGLDPDLIAAAMTHVLSGSILTNA